MSSGPHPPHPIYSPSTKVPEHSRRGRGNHIDRTRLHKRLVVLTSRIPEETRVLSRSPRLDEQRVTFFALKIKTVSPEPIFFIEKTRRSPIAHIKTLCAVVFFPLFLFLIRGLFGRKPKTIFLRTCSYPGFDTEKIHRHSFEISPCLIVW